MPINLGLRTFWALAVALLLCLPVGAQSLLVPMDAAQSDHLRAYGLTYWCLQEPRGLECEWLLNYRGGSFLLPDSPAVRDHANTMGVAVEPLGDAARQSIYATIRTANMERVQLTKAPKIAVYVPPDAEPWDDAVRLALEYAQIEYVKLWDREVLAGKLADYEWLHLHHEDFTGQFGRFFSTFQNQPWYRRMVMSSRAVAQELGYTSVQEEKGAVAGRLADWTAAGGFLFAMCSAPDSLDIALSARGRDIVPAEIDGTPVDPAADANLNYAATLAFRGFHLAKNPFVPELSDIDVPPAPGDLVYRGQTFELFEFSAKQDPIATMLNQCHVKAVPDFLGLTTAFRRSLLKSTAIVLGDFPGDLKVKYIHGDFGKGTYTFLAGHDPEDYAHVVGEPPTDLTQHRHSPGYRLILNNVLFPAAKTRERKT